MSDERMRSEEHRVSGERLVARVKELIHQGNVRRVIVKNDDGQTILEIPFTLGVVGAALLPSLVALGAIAALAAEPADVGEGACCIQTRNQDNLAKR